jgi:hypothetical protein
MIKFTTLDLIFKGIKGGLAHPRTNFWKGLIEKVQVLWKANPPIMKKQPQTFLAQQDLSMYCW